MNVSVEELNQVQKKLILEVPAEEVTKSLEEQFRRLGKVVSVRGFRAGKVPKEIVRKMYAAEAQQEAAKQLLTKHFQSALQETGLKPLVMPEISNDPVRDGSPLRYTIVCDVLPVFDAIDIDDLSIPVERSEPSEEELEAKVQELRQRHGELETVEGRGADTGDRVEIKYLGRLMGEDTAFTGNEALTGHVVLGEEWIYPSVTDRLAGAKAGDRFDVGHTFAADHANPEQAGKEALFEVEVVAVSRQVLPDVDDAFAKDAGFEDVGALRASLYDELVRGLRSADAERCERAVTDAILEKNTVEAPVPLLRAHVDEALQHIASNFKRMGLTDDLVQRLIDREAERIVATSRRAVQRDLVLDKLADTLAVAVGAEEVEASLSELAERLRQPLAKIKGQLERGMGLEDYTRRLRRERTMNALVARAKAKAA